MRPLAIMGTPRGRYFFVDAIYRIVQREPAPLLLCRIAGKDEPTTIRNVFNRFVTNRLWK